MTQAKTPGSYTNVKELDTTTQIPTDITGETLPGVLDQFKDNEEVYINDVEDTSADFTFTYVAPDNGRIAGLRYANGSVAMSGSVGWELDFLNLSDSSNSLFYAGLGTGTEAAKATDKVDAVAANATTEIANSDTTSTSRFNKGDKISLTADRDGTTGVGVFALLLDYSSQGR